MNTSSREDSKSLVREYVNHGWLSPAQGDQLVDLIENGMEDTALAIVSNVTETHS